MSTNHRRTTPPRGRLIVVGGLWAALHACGGGAGSATGAAQVTISALASDGIDAVELRITGTGIPSPIVVALGREQAGWGALVGAIPSGPGRTFSLSARDAMGAETFRGQVGDVVIMAGATVTVIIVAQPVSTPPAYTNAAPVVDGLFLSSSAVAPGDDVQLRVAAHDPDPADVISFAWSAPGGTFTAATSAATTWAAPEREGTFRITVRVTDRKGTSAAASVDIQVAAGFGRGMARVEVGFNNWPSVLAIQVDPARLDVGAPVMVSVNASDPDGDALSYEWSSDCAGSFGSADAAQSSFVIAMSPASATCTLGVAIEDGRGGSNTGTIVVPIGDPTIDRAPMMTDTQQSLTFAAPGDTVAFTVSAVDPEGGPLTFSWSANGGAFTRPVTAGGSSSVTWTPSVTDGPLGLVRIIVTDSANNPTTLDFKVEVGLSWCPPFGSACANADEVCVPVELDNLSGACLPHGSAGDGTPCAPSLGSTGCQAGYACVTEAGADLCRKECDLFDGRVTCVLGQRCSVDGVCSSIAGDAASLGAACSPGADEGTWCGAETDRWRGVCTASDAGLVCSEVCGLGAAGCGSPSRECVAAFDDGFEVGVCVERGACGDGGTEYASCDRCLVAEAGACCASKSTACAGGTACGVLTDCLKSCGESDGSCRDQCMVAWPDGVSPLLDLTTCLQGSITQGFVGACGAICQ